jgi:hypothetical protein
MIKEYTIAVQTEPDLTPEELDAVRGGVMQTGGQLLNPQPLPPLKIGIHFLNPQPLPPG